MKIRGRATRNATTTTVPQPHDCRFNQSPWDITNDFSPPSSPFHLSPSPEVQEFAMIESSDAYISDLKWEECEDDLTGQEFDHTDSDGAGGSSKVGLLCCKTDGKKWKCKREAMYGNKLCEHHLALASKLSNDKKKKSTAMVESAVVVDTEGGEKRVRTKKPDAAANPSKMYYYSRFGPRCGKRRGKDSVTDNNLSAKRFDRETVKGPSSAKVMNDGVDYAEDDDDEDEEVGLRKNKRVKKPIKARSLKSLM